ncbi:MAG TPA: hypothetical protein VGM01_09795 [Ktedonobacteraceae bacterium]
MQRALFLAWKAAHFVCAKRLMPSLPALVEGLERRHHLHLTEEERCQVQTMSVATAERFLRTQPRPHLHGLSTTSPGVLRKSQIPVRTFAQWEDERPGFVEMDLVAHCGTHADGGFLYTLMHCLKKAFQNQSSESLSLPLLSLTLQPSLKRVHGSLAIQDSTRYTRKQEEGCDEASGGASVAFQRRAFLDRLTVLKASIQATL